MRAWITATLTLALLSGADAAGYTDFLQTLRAYPSVTQAQLGVQTAQTALNATGFPVAVSAQGALVGYPTVNDPAAYCATAPGAAFSTVCAPVPATVTTLNLAVRAASIPVGDTAARQQQARINLAQAQLGARQALVTVEVQAIEAAQRVQLAQHSLTLAQQGLSSAQLAVQATQNRVNAGGATQTDLQQAQLVLAQAQAGVQQAQENAALASAQLRDLTGSDSAPALPAPTVPQPRPAQAVTQAQFAAQKAQTTLDQAHWDALPTLSANYTHYTSSTTGVGVSVDSRSLAPALTLSIAPRTPPLDRVRDQYSLGVNFDLSASTLAAQQGAQSAVQQAQLALQAAQRQSDLALQGLDTTHAQASRQRTLAEQALALAQQQQKDATTRQDLGLATPIDVAQAAVNAYQAQLNLDQAQLAETDATLKYYAFYALPIEEVNP